MVSCTWKPGNLGLALAKLGGWTYRKGGGELATTCETLRKLCVCGTCLCMLKDAWNGLHVGLLQLLSLYSSHWNPLSQDFQVQFAHFYMSFFQQSIRTTTLLLQHRLQPVKATSVVSSIFSRCPSRHCRSMKVIMFTPSSCHPIPESSFQHNSSTILSPGQRSLYVHQNLLAGPTATAAIPPMHEQSDSTMLRLILSSHNHHRAHYVTTPTW